MQNRIVSALILGACAGQSFAGSGFYATIGGGWDNPSHNSNSSQSSAYVIYGPTAAPSGESIFNLPNVDWHNKYKNGFDLNAALGYQILPAWRADVEFLYQRFKRNVVGTYDWAEFDALSTATVDSVVGIQMTPSSGWVNVYSAMTNGYYDYHLNSKWTPSFGVGFGVAWIRAGSTVANGSFRTPMASATTEQTSPELAGTAFAWQIKAAVAYDWSKLLAVMLQYRLFATSEFLAEPSKIVTNPNLGSAARTFNVSRQKINGLLNNSIELVLRFKL